MDPFLGSLAISTGSSLLGGLFGGKKQKSSYEMSPEERQLYQSLLMRLKQPTPSYLTSPIAAKYGALKRNIKEDVGENLGTGSGLLQAQLRKATTGESRALGEMGEQYRQGILSQLTGLVGGRGTRAVETPTDWGSIFGGMGEDIGFLWGLQQAFGDRQKDRRWS
jgi:hypothetical protein